MHAMPHVSAEVPAAVVHPVVNVSGSKHRTVRVWSGGPMVVQHSKNRNELMHVKHLTSSLYSVSLELLVSSVVSMTVESSWLVGHLITESRTSQP